MLNPVILQNYNAIMDLFGLIEFRWGIYPPEGRVYFFNKSCVLLLILGSLNLDCEIKTLKDKSREQKQVQEMKELLKDELFGGGFF